MRRLVLALSLAAAASLSAIPAAAATRTTLYNFCAKADCADGGVPTGVTMGSDGNIYGVTGLGGRASGRGGTVFKLVHLASGRWQNIVLYSFCAVFECEDGASPAGAPILGSDGSIYGTAEGGGQNGGEAYKLTPNKKGTKWKLQIIGKLTEPRESLIYFGQSYGQAYDGVAPLYGLSHTNPGGSVVKLSHDTGSWKVTSLYDFCKLANCADGTAPLGDLAMDSSGIIYGVAGGGGAHGSGTVFKLVLNRGVWSETVLYSFCLLSHCDDGQSPISGLTLDPAAGALYGMTARGGLHNNGELFKIRLSNPTNEIPLYSFCSQSDCADGRYPHLNSLAVDASGNVYGTTPQGGGHNTDQFLMGWGAAFSVTAGGTMTTTYHFCAKANCTDGATPSGPLALGPNGSIIGTTRGGGTYGQGTVFMIKP